MVAAVNVQATSQAPLDSGADTIAVGVFEGEDVARDLPGEPLAALLACGEARREKGAIAVTHFNGRRLVLTGLGRREAWDGERARAAAALVHGRARELGARCLAWDVPDHAGEETVAGLVEGTLLHAYRFDRYRRKPRGRPAVESLVVSASRDIAAQAQRAAVIASAQNRARDLGNLPANELTPSALAEYALALDGRDGLAVTVMDEDQIRSAGMGAFAAVAQGSAQPARLIELRYDGSADPLVPRLGLVGKAITFDSGGISLKPAASMQDMKFDMCGGAAVIEAIAALAALRAPVRVLGVVGASENLPGSTAVKPGDIVRALDGTTVEVNNTDAEGRLVLGDCLVHARREGCGRIVDIATLTGAVEVALGSAYAGLMSNDDTWAQALQSAGARTGELVWRLPLHERYADMVRGRYADLTNRTERREAGAITAAEFLHHFVGDVPWAHLDIAGVSDGLRRPYLDKGASGFGVRLLVELAQTAG
jgi:leucyl aminopeptidase